MGGHRSRSASFSRVLIAIFLLALAFVAEPAGATHESKPIVLVHGLSLSNGIDCDARWNDLRGALNAWGWGGDGTPIVDVGYYKWDSGCAQWINPHGSHDKHFGNNWRADSHTSNDSGTCSDCQHSHHTSIKHLGFHLAWYIENEFDSEGKCVELVGHSMGGLIARYAIAQVENDHPAFPASICVQDVITYGTPHAGTPATRDCDGWPVNSLECEEMVGRDDCDASDPNGTSDFITLLRDIAWDPDGRDGTQWTLMGSYKDEHVPENCAVWNMRRYSAVRYLPMGGDPANVEHSDYPKDIEDDWTADAEYKKGSGDWVTDYTAPWAVKWADLALGSSDW